MNKVRHFAEKYGYLPAIDGRMIRIRSYEGRLLIHTALNAKLQADGSILVKKAMVLANEEVKRRGLDAFQILFYHDELAYDSSPEYAEEVGNILTDSMLKAGEHFKLRIPTDGQYKVGKDWSIH